MALVVVEQLARRRRTTSDQMLAECAQVACRDCRAVLVEMQDAVHHGIDADGWWREQFKLARESVSAGHHVHLQP